MDVRMPDGTIITNVPDNITQTELLARYSRMQGIGVETGTKNPFMGAVGRAAGLAASGVEAVAEVAERAGDYLESKIPLSNIPPEQIKSEKQLKPLFDLAGSLRNVEKDIGYSPSTKLSELADNPLNAVPFIAERIITSTPDMAAAVFAFMPYIGARTKEILDERVKNDNKTLDDATVEDVAAATGAAVAEATIERFATKRLGKGAEAQTRTGRLAKETGVQGGTEAVEETAAYLGETAGTIKGVDPRELGERALEGAIVGGGLGGGVQATREVLTGKKETPPPEKQEELKNLAESSAEERLIREQQIEAQEPVPQPTEPGMAPDELAMAALARRTPEKEVAELQKSVAAKPIEPTIPTERVTPLAEIVEEAPEIPETRPYEYKEKPPVPEEITTLEAEKKAAEREVSRAMREKGPSLATVLRNRLNASEVFDISPDPGVAKVFRMSPKRGRGENIADVLANTNELDDFVDPQLLTPERETEAVEYIKDKIRNQNYLTFQTDISLQKLNMDLAQVEELLARELTDEQIRAEANAIAAEIAAEEGLSPAETAPEILTTGDIGERAAPEGEPEVGFRQVVPQKLDQVQTRTVYRTGSSGLVSMPKDVTAQDVVSYEQDELGNQDIKAVPGVDLKTIPANRLSWVTFNQKDAEQYVNREAPIEDQSKVTSRKATFRVVATDGSGGYLIEEVRPEVGFRQVVGPKDDPKRYEIRTKKSYRGRTTADVAYELYKDGKFMQAFSRKKDAQEMLDVYTMPDEQLYAKYPALKPSEADLRTRAEVEAAARQKAPEIKVRIDNPGGEWLKNKQEDSIRDGLNQFNVPRRFGSVTASLNRYVLVPVDKLAKIKGMRGEQMPENIRPQSLEYLTKQMSETGRLPPSSIEGEDYVPFLNVYQDGTPYVNEGNHRIMVAKKLGWKYIPVQVSWFNGAEKAGGDFTPDALLADDQKAYKEGFSLQRYSPKTMGEFELEAETAEETVARQERDAEEAQKRELKKIADNERDLFKLEQQSSPASPPVQGRLFDVTTATPIPVVTEAESTPSFAREFDRLSKMLDKGTINPEEFAARVQMARRSILAAKEAKPIPARVRGADYIMERLLRAKRQGIITEEAVELTDWFIKQNPELVKDLGLSIRMSDTKGGEAGMYMPTARIARLVGGSVKTDTAIHEILHHLERMMPAKVQNDIQKSWLKNFAAEQKKAVDTKDTNAIKYFELLGQHHSTGKAAPFEEALELIKNGSVPYQLYQYANPSEFWAVNASRIMQGKFDVRGDRLGTLKTWLSKLAQKIKEVFGFKSDASIIRALDSLAKSDGKFVSTEMLASGDIFPSVRTNVFGGKPPQPAWGRPDDSKTDDIIFFLQDKQVDTKRVIEGIEKAAGRLKDRWNAYMQEELYHGRTAKKTNDFIQKELNPLLRDMKAKGFTVADVEEFLHNRHAQERNEQVAKVNPNMPDGGSGILTADAKAYLASLSPAKRKSLEAIAKRVDDITQSTRKILVDTGLELPSTIQAWEKAYKNYVPLNRAEDDYELSGIGKGVGQGFSVRGPSSRRATGSSREVVDILANIAMQRERAIVRSEKSRVSQAIYGLAIQHPNPDFWLAIDPTAVQDPAKTAQDLQSMGINPVDAANIMAEPTQTYVDPNTGLVTKRINPALRGAENVLAVRVNGEDKFVFFNTKDPRALRMATALKNLDADQLGTAMSMVARVTRYFAAVNTQYNPIFGVINFLRDYQGAALNLTSTPIAGETKKVMKDTWPALMGIYADLRKARKGQGPATSKWANLWEEFQKEGGQTGFRDQFSRSQERADALERELNRLSEGKPMQSARAIFDWLSDYNESMENAVRLAAYKAGLDKGLTKEQAASVAKNLTVNFNRKGQVARQTNALYAFFNASVQGTARMYQTLRGPAGKKIMYGGLLLGSAQALLLAAAGFDEDEPPDFVKERNIVIPTGGGKYVTIPMPLGFNIIPNTSRVITEWFMSGGKDTSKRIAQILGATLEMFNPIGNAGWSLQTFAPTVLDPVAALGENKDWTGKPIAKEDISSLDPTPGYTRAKDTASWFSKNLAEFLNYATGGTKYRPGFVSPTPDQIDYLIGQATGGVGREVMKAEQTVTSAVTGEELPTYKIPLVGRFIGETKGQAAQRDRFYDNIKLLNEHENEIKGRRKNREPVEEYIRKNPESRLFGAANTVERQIQVLRRRREDLLKKDAPKSEIQAVEKRITEIMTAFNERVRKVKEGK